MRDSIDRFEARTKAFAVAAIRLSGELERLPGVRFVVDQLARSSGSVAANHRAMRRARSTREFAAKLQIVNEEIDEAVLWVEIVEEVRPDCRDRLNPLLHEGIELRSMFAAARGTLRRRSQ